MKKAKKVFRAIGCILLALLIVVIGYLAYVLIDYSRIEDNVVLDVSHASEKDALEVGVSYTVVSQNLGFGAYTPDFTFFMDGGKESWAASKESVISCIGQGADKARSFSPDFILFQEVDTDSTRSYHVDQRVLLYDAFPEFDSVFACNYHSSFLAIPPWQPHGSSNSGILTFSAYPATSALRRSLPISESFSKFTDLDRCFSVTRIPVANGKELILYNVHLSAYGGSDEIHAAQMNLLFSDMKKEYDAGNYCVCGGDFNHDFTGTSVPTLNDENTERSGWCMPFPTELLPEHIVQAIDYTCGEQRPSCRNCDVPYVEGNFTVIVDGFVVSDNVTVEYLENVQTGFAYSDHNPVLMRFVLNDTTMESEG